MLLGAMETVCGKVESASMLPVSIAGINRYGIVIGCLTETETGCDGGDTCCSSTSYKCDIGEGDCDSDSDCLPWLKCGKDNCFGPGFDDTDDCCMSLP